MGVEVYFIPVLFLALRPPTLSDSPVRHNTFTSSKHLFCFCEEFWVNHSAPAIIIFIEPMMFHRGPAHTTDPECFTCMSEIIIPALILLKIYYYSSLVLSDMMMISWYWCVLSYLFYNFIIFFLNNCILNGNSWFEVKHFQVVKWCFFILPRLICKCRAVLSAYGSMLKSFRSFSYGIVYCNSMYKHFSPMIGGGFTILPCQVTSYLEFWKWLSYSKPILLIKIANYTALRKNICDIFFLLFSYYCPG